MQNVWNEGAQCRFLPNWTAHEDLLRLVEGNGTPEEKWEIFTTWWINQKPL